MTQQTPKTDITIIRDQIEVLSIAEGFFQSSILFALLRLEIFEHINDGSKTLYDLAEELGTQPETLARLLNAGVMLKLLKTDDGLTYRVAPACRAVLLPSAGESYLGNWILLQGEFYSALSDLEKAILKSGPAIDPSIYLGADKERTRQYILAMHNYASLRGKEIAHYLDTSTCKTLLDLGCGPGTYAFHLGMRNPSLKLYLSDLPEILEVAKEVQTRYPIENEVHYLSLDAANDEIPGSYDMILASNMLHCFEKRVRSKLIERLYHAINPNGSLVVQAQYLQENRLGGRWAIYVDLNLLCTTKSGRNHTVMETRRWLEEAGFINIEYCPMSVYGVNSFLRGYKAT